MKKINILKDNRDFSRIIKSTKPHKSKTFIVYLERVIDGNYQFGISVSKKIGNAVVRNKIKRQLKSIIDSKDYQKDFNCIIIVTKNILNCSYQEIECELIKLFNKINIIKE